MNTLIAFIETTVAIQNSDNQGYNWPAILIGVIGIICLVTYIVKDAMKPTEYDKKVERWNLGIADRDKELLDINKKLSGKSFVVIIRDPDRKVNCIEPSLIQLLTDGGATVIRISKDAGDKTLFDSRSYDFTGLIVTGIMRVIKNEGCLTRYCLDLRISKHDPVVGRDDVYLKTVNISEENIEWLKFAFLQHIGSVCSK